MTTERHIHINGYNGVTRPLAAKLRRYGFFEDPITPDPRLNHPCPPSHFTYKSMDPTEIRTRWAAAVHILDKSAFRGYVEAETLPPNWTTHLPSKELAFAEAFPIYIPSMQAVPIGKHKASDIHLEFPVGLVLGTLETTLTANGFFKVLCPEEQIFTLQLASIRDTKAVVEALVRFFRNCMGCTKVEAEVASRFKRYPYDFEVAPIVPEAGVIFR